ncbi:LOW QUALITY PROTEIN: sialidase-3 [Nothobranchius furzeri]|uniref:LOW QUALITY PROTEIN: sialidase-3 n=1 Tax=Nothobranchius furzeri TaxID=105023 RepID=UPI0039049813
MSISVFKDWVYRTPAMVYNKDSCILLVFSNATTAVGRHRRLAMRKFLFDRGRNFSPMWCKTQIVREASLPGHSSMNPCPMFDEENRKLFLFFMVTSNEHLHEEHLFYKSRLCYITSNNFGHSWSEVNHLTVCLPENCIALAIGRGHGLQTEDGRLIIPTFAFIDENPTDENLFHMQSLCIVTMVEKAGSLVPENTAECQMAEVWGHGGRFIYCNAINKDRRLVEAFSEDNGDTFIVSEDGKFANTCTGSPGSLLSFPVKDKTAMGSDVSPSPNRWLLFTQPSISGVELGVYVNKTPCDPKAWTKPWIINRGPSGLSDMAYLGDGYIACVFETRENEDLDNVVMKIFNFYHIWPNTDDTDGCLCCCTVM